MNKTFDITILTPEEKIYEGKIVSLVAPSEWGYLGVLANHAPLIANLAKGTITLRDNKGDLAKFSSKGGGVIEVLRNNVTMLLTSQS